MKKIFIILILSFLFTNNVFAKAGKGEVYLSKEAMETFLDYLYGGAKNLNPNTGGGTRNKNLKSKPLLFTVSETGDSYSYNYCTFQNCREPNRHQAILGCQQYSGGTACFTFAAKKRIIWKNKKNPKGLSLVKELKYGRDHVANIIKEAGYYNGDITLLENFKKNIFSSKLAKSQSKKKNKKDW